MINETVLDNPVWFALKEQHTNYCTDYGSVKFYNPEYTPFGAFTNNEDTTEAIKRFSKLTTSFIIFGNQPKLPENFQPAIRYCGYQMILREKIKHSITEEIIELNQKHHKDLMALVKLVYPLFFKEKTHRLGRYYGIYKNKTLVAVAGERIQTKHYTEISSVITHPEYTGKGYAKQIITHATNNIFNANKTPFLHVDETNTNPIKLYKKLGFNLRRKLNFWKIHVPN